MKNFGKSLTIDAVEIVRVIDYSMKQIGFVLLCWVFCSVLLPMQAHGQSIAVEKNQRTLTHVVRVEVSDQSEQQRRAALRNAFSQVILKMSGNRDDITQAVIRRLQPNAASLLKAYQYEIEDRRIYYVATFDQPRLQDLLLQNNLPIWDQRRPSGMLWLMVYEPQRDDAVLLSESMTSAATTSDSNLAISLLNNVQSVSESRGVQIGVPLYDIEDASLVSYYDVWGRFMSPISTATERYGVNHFIAARIHQSPEYDEEALKQRLAQLEAIALVAKAESLALFNGAQIDSSATIEPEIGDLDRVLAELSKQSAALSDEDIQQYELGQLGFNDPSLPQIENNIPQSAQRDNTQILFNYDEFTTLLAPLQPLQLEYSFQAGEQFASGVIGGTDEAELVEELIHRYADMLSQLYAIESISGAQTPWMQITVNNVASIKDYAEILSLLSGLSVVDFASLDSIHATTATFNLRLLSDSQRMIEALLLDGRLVPQQDEFGNVVETTNFEWRGPR
jgi:hypothetical protein